MGLELPNLEIPLLSSYLHMRLIIHVGTSRDVGNGQADLNAATCAAAVELYAACRPHFP